MLLLILDKLNDLVWTGIFLPCVLLCGLLLSLRSRFLQLRLFPASLRQLTKGGRGDGVSPVQAASTALASTLGTGNIVGTAQAIAMGGPGAVFWMWAAALLGMAVKFAEISLSVATRRRDGVGYSGGPMYYIGSLGEKFRPLALMYALLAALSAFGIGNLSQISSAAGAVAGAAEKIAPELDPRRLRLWLGVILTLTAWLILRGGAAGVGRAAERLVPSMAGLFLLLSLFVLCCHAQALPAALRAIVTGAFSPRTAVSGIGGFGTAQAIQWGLRRGAFSNEAGLGSSAIAHGSAAALARRAGAVGHIRGLCRHDSHLHRNCADHTVQRRGHPMGQLAGGGAAALGLGDLHPRRARRVLHGAVAAAVRVHVGTRLGAVRDAVRQVFMG